MPNKKKQTASNDAVTQLLQQMRQLILQTNQRREQPSRRKRRRRAGPSTVASNEGSITISRCELCSEVSVKASAKDGVKGHVDILPDSFPYLKTLFKSFDRLMWRKLHFYYKPAVGTTFGGLFSMGFDWDWSTGDVSREKISALTPNMACAAWNDTEKSPLALNAGKLNVWYQPRSQEYVTRGPGRLDYALVAATDKDLVVGEIWVSYTVAMYGTNPS